MRVGKAGVNFLLTNSFNSVKTMPFMSSASRNGHSRYPHSSVNIEAFIAPSLQDAMSFASRINRELEKLSWNFGRAIGKNIVLYNANYLIS